ncbi:hypothetical protein NMG60_11037558 [Bertholletia excelsa]
MGREGKSKEEKRKKKRSSLSDSEDDRKLKKRRTAEDNEGRSSKSDKKEKSKKKHKSHKSSKHHSDKEKRTKEKSKSKHGKHDSKHKLNFQELSADDYFSKNNEFATWLKEEKDMFFSDLSSESARNLFSQFVEDWNSQKLGSQYYEGISTGPRTAHKWKIKQ